MLHYSCDRCKRSIDSENELRYEVRLEVRGSMEAGEGERIDHDRDHLLDLQEILDRQEDAEDENIGEDIYQKSFFDLCPQCYRKFIRNPLGRESVPQLNFSKN